MTTISEIFPEWGECTPRQRWERVTARHPVEVRKMGNARDFGRPLAAVMHQERADVLYDEALRLSLAQPAYWASPWWRQGGGA